jgi:hypothetical protein
MSETVSELERWLETDGCPLPDEETWAAMQEVLRLAKLAQSLTAERDALREALRPFAREADDWPDKMDCEDIPADATDIKIVDLRRARAALKNASGEVG